MNIGVSIARRLATAVLTLILATLIVTLLLDLAPGGPESAIAGNSATAEQLELIREKYGLDEPVFGRYLAWLVAALQWNMGRSFITNEPVASAIAESMLVTGPLVGVSFILIVVLGTLAGYAAAQRDASGLDRTLTTIALIGACAPVFVVAIGLQIVFSVELGWLPAIGTGITFQERAAHLLMPIAAMTFAGIAALMQVVRTRVREVIREDYVVFARARGLSSNQIRGYVLRNAAIQIVTRAGTIVIALVSFAMLVEETFGLDGLGTLLLKAASERDVPVVQGVILVVAIFVVLVNFAVDALYAVIDPRTARKRKVVPAASGQSDEVHEHGKVGA